MCRSEKPVRIGRQGKYRVGTDVPEAVLAFRAQPPDFQRPASFWLKFLALDRTLFIIQTAIFG